MSNDSEPSIVVFDGECNMCARSVQFMLKRDPKGRLRFASRQSEFGMGLRRQYGLEDPKFDSIVLVQNGQAYIRSDATLRIARGLSGAWPLLSLFLLVPRALRDMGYNFIAKRRIKWFGRSETCMVPSPEVRSRFLG